MDKIKNVMIYRIKYINKMIKTLALEKKFDKIRYLY